MSVLADEIIAVISLAEETSAVAAYVASYVASGRIIASDSNSEMRSIIVAERDGMRFICFSAKQSGAVHKQIIEYGYITI